MIEFVLQRLLGWLAAAAVTAVPPTDANRLVEYQVVEKVVSVTPHGPSSSALVGRVIVSGDDARWQLEAGTFPHSTASIALVHRGAITLLDPAERLSAAASVEEFDAILRGVASGESGGTNSSIRDVELSVKPDGAGRPFQGASTKRHSFDLRWVIAMQSPGRFVQVRNTLKGIVETSSEFEDARTPFDELARLLPLRGTALDSLSPELHRISGLPVFVSFEVTSEVQSEAVGTDVAAGMQKSPRTTTSITRSVSGLVRRKREAADGPAFEVPEEFHSRGLDRLRRSASSLP